MRMASVAERSPIVKFRSRILVVLQIFYKLIMFLARCRFFVLVRSTPCVDGQFIQHFFVESYVTTSSSVHLSATSS